MADVVPTEPMQTPAEKEASERDRARDPFGTRHQLSNLAMVAIGLDAAPEVVLAIRVMALSGLFVGEMLGSIFLEVRQWREQAARRPPKRTGP